MSTEHRDDEYDHERMLAIGKAVADTAMASRALEQGAEDNQVYQDLIQLCRRWWACWNAMGLLSAAGMSDTGDVAYAFDGMKDAAARLEVDIIKTGRAAEFFAWTKKHLEQPNFWFEPAGIDTHELWDEFYGETRS